MQLCGVEIETRISWMRLGANEKFGLISITASPKEKKSQMLYWQKTPPMYNLASWNGLSLPESFYHQIVTKIKLTAA